MIRHIIQVIGCSVLIVLCFVSMATALGALMHNYTSLALIVLVTSVAAIVRSFRRATMIAAFQYVSLYIIAIPAVGFFVMHFFMETAIDHSRNTAITLEVFLV